MPTSLRSMCSSDRDFISPWIKVPTSTKPKGLLARRSVLRVWLFLNELRSTRHVTKPSVLPLKSRCVIVEFSASACAMYVPA